MRNAIYIDEERQGIMLGRFGRIHYGDHKELTEHEVETVVGDDDTSKRWLILDEKSKVPDDIPKNVLQKAEVFKAARSEAVKATLLASGASEDEAEAGADAAEANREETASKETSRGSAKLELEQKTKGELLDYARRAKQNGLPVVVNQRMSKKNIVREILRAQEDRDNG